MILPYSAHIRHTFRETDDKKEFLWVLETVSVIVYVITNIVD